MKIAILASEFYPPYGGVGIYTQHLVTELSKKHDVHVFTAKRVPKSQVMKKFPNITLHYVCDAKGDFLYNIVFQIKLFFTFMGYHKRHHFDIIHSMNLVNMPDIFLRLRHNIPTVVTAHSSIWTQMGATLSAQKNVLKMAPSEKGSLVAFPYIAAMEWVYLKTTKNLITVSNEYVNYFRNYGYKGQLTPIHNGIDLKVFNKSKVHPHPQLAKIKKTKVLYVGRLLAMKGMHLLVDAIKNLPDCHFVIAGNGGVKEFQKLLHSHKIPSSRVTFLGYVQNHELPSVYNACDIFVLPSYTENFPITILEAMSMGCAVIASDVGAVKEMIKHQENGILITPGNGKEFNRWIDELDKDQEMRNVLTSHAYEDVSIKYASSIMAQQTEQVYKQMLEKSK